MEKQLKGLFKSCTGVVPSHIEPLVASGSNRRYYRIYAGQPENAVGGEHPPAVKTAIGVIGTDPEENRAFCTLARHFTSRGINVPEIYAVSDDWMCYLQGDLGTLSLFDAVASGRSAASSPGHMADGAKSHADNYSCQERELLLKTIAMLPKIQFDGADGLDFSVCHPQQDFDGRLIMFDLNYFKYCYLKTAGVEFNAMQLEDDFERLRDDLLKAGDMAFMYRDFQARNVMLVGGEPYFIDFQGGMHGPIYYDLASFVWQARACYPDGLKEEMIRAYLVAAEKYIRVDERQFRKNLSLFVLFRTLQVLGAYGFRGNFEKKRHFIDSIPFALENLSGLLPEFRDSYPYLCEVLQNVVASGKDSAGPQATAADSVSQVQGLADAAQSRCLEVEIYSFSYKNGIPQDRSGNGGGYVFDCRSLNNPGRYPQYRNSTGRDADVIKFLEDDGEISGFLEHVYGVVVPHVETFLRRGFTHLMVSFGCTGGQHRSVYCAEHLAMYLKERYSSGIADGVLRIVLRHREQNVNVLYAGQAGGKETL